MTTLNLQQAHDMALAMLERGAALHKDAASPAWRRDVGGRVMVQAMTSLELHGAIEAAAILDDREYVAWAVRELGCTLSVAEDLEADLQAAPLQLAVWAPQA
jgi:hypothetical protein